jgi:hypothetical protein
METKQEEKKLPERKKSFKISDNTYSVDFPSTGGLIEIESLKAQLARNNYSGIVDNGTIMSNYSRFLIDMIATFNVLFPQLKKDMNVKSISELHPLDSKKLLQVYLKEVLPWLQEWFDILNNDEDETKEIKNDK